MPEQKPTSLIISRSKRVRCSILCASNNFPCCLKRANLLLKLLLDGDDRVFLFPRRCDKVRGGEDGDGVLALQDFAREGIDYSDPLDLVAEELDSDDDFFVGGLHFEDVAPHPKCRAREGHVVSGELHIDEAAQGVVPVHFLSALERQDDLRVLFRRSEAVDARDGRDDDDVAPL